MRSFSCKTAALCVCCLMMAMLTLTGCSSDKAKDTAQQAVTVLEQHPDEVRQAAAAGVKLGLKQLAKKHADEAQLTALLLSANAKAGAEYFSGGQLPMGQQAAEMIAALGKNVPATAAPIAVASIALLQTFVSVPEAKTYLRPEEAALIAAFLTGVKQGCEAFLEAK